MDKLYGDTSAEPFPLIAAYDKGERIICIGNQMLPENKVYGAATKVAGAAVRQAHVMGYNSSATISKLRK